MSTGRHIKGGDRHEIADATEEGNFLTKCGKLLMGRETVVAVSELPDCPGCASPEVEQQLTAPSTGRPIRQYRRPKNQRRETTESLQFAHKAIVASLEWVQRGEDLQFLPQALDQAKLGYRFLKEVLDSFNWIDEEDVIE